MLVAYHDQCALVTMVTGSGWYECTSVWAQWVWQELIIQNIRRGTCHYVCSLIIKMNFPLVVAFVWRKVDKTTQEQIVLCSTGYLSCMYSILHSVLHTPFYTPYYALATMLSLLECQKSPYSVECLLFN